MEYCIYGPGTEADEIARLRFRIRQLEQTLAGATAMLRERRKILLEVQEMLAKAASLD